RDIRHVWRGSQQEGPYQPGFEKSPIPAETFEMLFICTEIRWSAFDDSDQPALLEQAVGRFLRLVPKQKLSKCLTHNLRLVDPDGCSSPLELLLKMFIDSHRDTFARHLSDIILICRT